MKFTGEHFMPGTDDIEPIRKVPRLGNSPINRLTQQMSMRISAIIPIYNGRRFLREAVESVVIQTLLPIELILVDDGSVDESLSAVEGLEFPLPVIKLRQDNAGQSSARNHGARVAKGDYLAFLDQDDSWEPRHLEKLAEPFAGGRRIAWVYSNLNEIDEQGNMVTIGLLDHLPARHPKCSLQQLLSEDLFILPSASLILRDAFLSVGGFDERLSGYEDDDLFLRLFRRGYHHVYLSEPLSRWRIHGSSSSYTWRMSKSRRIYAAKLIRNYPDDPHSERFWVRDCVAPRFFGDAHGELLYSLRIRNYERYEAALADMRRYMQFIAVGWRRRLMLVFLGISPRLSFFLTQFAYSLPTPARRAILRALLG